MDILKFNNPTSPTLMEDAEIVTGMTSKMWVERYADNGEFRFIAPVDSGVMEKLTIGSLISHTDTSEIMIVEDHEIDDSDEEGVPDVVITGRSFETWLEQRTIGFNFTLVKGSYATPAPWPPYEIASDVSWNQIVETIKEHVYPARMKTGQGSFGVPYITVIADVTPEGTERQVPRRYNRIPLYDVIRELLNYNKCGIKNVRPGPWSPIGGSPNIAVVVHRGEDKSATVILSKDTGDITKAKYLWSLRNVKNAAFYETKWTRERFFLDYTTGGFNQRMKYYDLSNVDYEYDTPPGTSTYNIVNGIGDDLVHDDLDKLANPVTLTEVQVARNLTRVKYRTDFNVGDVIKVQGDYNATSLMRVIEYVESEDEESGYVEFPGLELIGPVVIID